MCIWTRLIEYLYYYSFIPHIVSYFTSYVSVDIPTTHYIPLIQSYEFVVVLKDLAKAINNQKVVEDKKIDIVQCVAKEPLTGEKNYVLDGPKRCKLSLEKDVFGSTQASKQMKKQRNKKSFLDKILKTKS